jgi:hypothetical protein
MWTDTLLMIDTEELVININLPLEIKHYVSGTKSDDSGNKGSRRSESRGYAGRHVHHFYASRSSA